MNKKIIIIVLFLIVGVGILSYLNLADSEDRLKNQKESVIFLQQNGESLTEVSFENIQNLEQHEFEEVLRSSDSPDREVVYKGVLLQDLLIENDISLAELEQVISKAVDGYTVALSQDEVKDEDNVYLVYKQDGEPLTPLEEGGSGPYQLVIREDDFGQRWNQGVMELDIR